MLKSLKTIVLISVFIIANLSLFAQSTVQQLSATEIELAQTVGFDQSIVADVKKLVNTKSERFYLPGKVKFVKGKQVETDKIYRKAILFYVTKQKADLAIAKLSKTLQQKGYIIFKSEGNMSKDLWRLGLFKTNDQFEILRVMGTNASESGHNNAWVIAYLKNIYQKYPFRIIGADIDWIEAEFITPPTDWPTFTKGLKKDCPDIFDDESDNTEEIAQKMKLSNKLYLLWE